MDITEIADRHQEATVALTDVYRLRVLTYGPDAARLMLRSFDDMTVLLQEIRGKVE